MRVLNTGYIVSLPSPNVYVEPEILPYSLLLKYQPKSDLDVESDDVLQLPPFALNVAFIPLGTVKFDNDTVSPGLPVTVVLPVEPLNFPPFGSIVNVYVLLVQ